MHCISLGSTNSQESASSLLQEVQGARIFSKYLYADGSVGKAVDLNVTCGRRVSPPKSSHPRLLKISVPRPSKIFTNTQSPPRRTRPSKCTSGSSCVPSSLLPPSSAFPHTRSAARRPRKRTRSCDWCRYSCPYACPTSQFRRCVLRVARCAPGAVGEARGQGRQPAHAAGLEWISV